MWMIEKNILNSCWNQAKNKHFCWYQNIKYYANSDRMLAVIQMTNKPQIGQNLPKKSQYATLHKLELE